MCEPLHSPSPNPVGKPPLRVRKADKGQNLVELVLTLGFSLVFLYTGIELARAWQAYHVTRSAAYDGALTASQTHSTAFGQQKIDERLNAVNLAIVSRSVVALNDGQTYQASVSVRFQPLFGTLRIPVPGRTISVAPGSFVLSYQSTQMPSTF